jgi:hypothetical protein
VSVLSDFDYFSDLSLEIDVTSVIPKTAMQIKSHSAVCENAARLKGVGSLPVD